MASTMGRNEYEITYVGRSYLPKFWLYVYYIWTVFFLHLHSGGSLMVRMSTQEFCGMLHCMVDSRISAYTGSVVSQKHIFLHLPQHEDFSFPLMQNPTFCQDTIHVISWASQSFQAANLACQDSTKKVKSSARIMGLSSPPASRAQSLSASMKKLGGCLHHSTEKKTTNMPHGKER